MRSSRLALAPARRSRTRSSSTCATQRRCPRRWRRSSGSTRRWASSSSRRALDPALMLEAMRAGVNECVTEPLSAGRSEGGHRSRRRPARRVDRQAQVFAFVGAKGGVGTTTLAVNVATALAKLARAADAAHRSARRRTAMRRCSSASSRGSRCRRAREHASARRGVSQEPGRARQVRARPAGVARRRLAPVDVQRHSRASIDFAAQQYRLRRARRAAFRRRRPRRARAASRRSSWSPTRSWRRCAAPRSMAARCGSATARTRSDVVVSRTTARRIGQEDIERVVGGAGQARVPERLPQRGRGAATRARPLVARQPQQAGGARSSSFAREPRRRRRRRQPTAKRPGLSAESAGRQ